MESKNEFRYAWQPYVVAIAIIAAAAALRLWPLQALGVRLTWLTFYPAVMVAALYGGLSAGLLGTVLSCLSVFFVLPVFFDQPFIRDSVDWLGVAVFFITCTMISGVAEATRRARARETQANEQLEAANIKLQEGITERNRAEEDVRRLNAGLEQRVIERTAQLKTEIEERKRAEEERERLMVNLKAAVTDADRNRAQLEAIFQSMQDGLVVFDMEGHVTLVNEAEARINGFGTAEDMKRNMEYFAKVYELADLDGRRLPVEQWPVSRIMRGESLYDVELRGRRTDTGQEWFFSFSGAPIYDEQGKQILAVTITRNITERKKAEENIHKLNEKLELRVIERTAQLQAANKELEAFSYSVSHDLRAPLRHIDGFGQILLEDYAGKLDDEGRRHLHRVREASQQMAQLIDDLLNLSRVTRAEMRREAVDLSRMAERVTEALKKTQPDRKAEFVIEDGLVAEGDERLLWVALDNLLGNAWKYTGKRPQTRIEFGRTNHDNRAAYFVRDNGVGFDMAYVHKLFGAFQRLHSVSEFPGTGIGLATVQRIVRRHGGEVWADAAVDKGATFYFTL